MRVTVARYKSGEALLAFYQEPVEVRRLAAKLLVEDPILPALGQGTLSQGPNQTLRHSSPATKVALSNHRQIFIHIPLVSPPRSRKIAAARACY
jgi:hypothetical protein